MFTEQMKGDMLPIGFIVSCMTLPRERRVTWRYESDVALSLRWGRESRVAFLLAGFLRDRTRQTTLTPRRLGRDCGLCTPPTQPPPLFSFCLSLSRGSSTNGDACANSRHSLSSSKSCAN